MVRNVHDMLHVLYSVVDRHETDIVLGLLYFHTNKYHTLPPLTGTCILKATCEILQSESYTMPLICYINKLQIEIK